jgi:hypothetical protein
MVQEYLVKDFSGDPKNPVLTIVYGEEIWKVLNNAKENEDLISIYLLGDCVLDWS